MQDGREIAFLHAASRFFALPGPPCCFQLEDRASVVMQTTLRVNESRTPRLHAALDAGPADLAVDG